MLAATALSKRKPELGLHSCLALLFQCLEDPFGQLDGCLRFGAGEDDKTLETAR